MYFENIAICHIGDKIFFAFYTYNLFLVFFAATRKNGSRPSTFGNTGSSSHHCVDIDDGILWSQYFLQRCWITGGSYSFQLLKQLIFDNKDARDQASSSDYAAPFMTSKKFFQNFDGLKKIPPLRVVFLKRPRLRKDAMEINWEERSINL